MASSEARLARTISGIELMTASNRPELIEALKNYFQEESESESSSLSSDESFDEEPSRSADEQQNVLQIDKHGELSTQQNERCDTSVSGDMRHDTVSQMGGAACDAPRLDSQLYETFSVADKQHDMPQTSGAVCDNERCYTSVLDDMRHDTMLQIGGAVCDNERPYTLVITDTPHNMQVIGCDKQSNVTQSHN